MIHGSALAVPLALLPTAHNLYLPPYDDNTLSQKSSQTLELKIRYIVVTLVSWPFLINMKIHPLYRRPRSTGITISVEYNTSINLFPKDQKISFLPDLTQKLS